MEEGLVGFCDGFFFVFDEVGEGFFDGVVEEYAVPVDVDEGWDADAAEEPFLF